MAEIDRLPESSDWIGLGFVERERRPKTHMELGIRLQMVGQLFSNTVSELEEFVVERSRKAVYDWVQKADLETGENDSPLQVSLGEAVVKIDDEICRLYSTVIWKRTSSS